MGLYAGFWKRFVAYVIDSILLGLGTAVVVGGSLGVAGVPAAQFEGILNLASIAVGFVYFTLMESSPAQATLGKQALGLRVTDEQGGRITWGRAAGRWLGKILSFLTLTIGFMMAGWTRRRQGLHDLLAGTLVVNRGVGPDHLSGVVEAPAGGGGMPGWAITLVVLVCMVPVLGVLAAIALPAYHDYTLRAQVALAMEQVRPLQAAVAEHHQERGQFPGSRDDIPLQLPDLRSEQVQRIELVDGAITLRFAEGAPFNGGALFLVPRSGASGIEWDCQVDGLPRRVLPQACRD